MIESISPPPSPEDAAAAVVDFANFRAERYAALADLYYEGIFLPKKAPVAIALYENALKCGAEFDPPKKLNVLQRICDFYLQRECYAKATIYLQALSAPQIFSLAQLYHTNNVIDCAVCCYEAFIRSPDAKDADDELRIRVFLIRELLKRSRYSDAAEYLCSSGKVIAELPDQLDAGERLLLAEYFFCRGRFAEVIASLSSLCSDPASRDAVHDPRREVLLFCAYCRCNDPAAAAEIFRLIPCNMLSANVICEGLSIMIGREGYGKLVLDLCYNVARQFPDRPEAPACAKCLKEEALAVEDYPAAEYWGRKAGDADQEQLKSLAHECRADRRAAVVAALFFAALLFFLPWSLKIPSWRTFGSVDWIAWLSGAFFVIAFARSCAKLFSAYGKGRVEKSRNKSKLVITALLLIGGGTLLNSNLGSPRLGKILCAAEVAAAVSLFLHLLLKQLYPLSYIRTILDRGRLICLSLAAGCALGTGKLLASCFGAEALIWCGLPVFVMTANLFQTLFLKTPGK